MAINPAKLVCPAILQNFVEAKTGIPLSNGVVTFYQDSNHVILKNVYQQTGTFGNYTYTAVNNPLILSAAGTTVDVNGNDILLFYYPWSETDENVEQPYFITVYDQYGTFQFSRSNFPFETTGGSSSVQNLVTQENYVINNRFWRNINTLSPSSSNVSTWTTQYASTGSVGHWTLAPDQHDGFSMPDFNYIVPTADVGNATETITFETFTASLSPEIVNDIQPEYYINHNCTADSGTYTKIYQFPITLHQATLANQPFVFTIQGMGSITLTIGIYAFNGTGAASSSISSLMPTIALQSGWQKFTLTGVFPTNFGVPSNTTGDDAYYLQIQFQSGQAAFSFALPSIYLYDNTSEIIDANSLFSFSTYDQIDTVICSPRTGDVRTSLNTFYPYGWLPMNNGTIGNASSGATAIYNALSTSSNIEMWPLYSLIWNAFSAYTVGGSSLVPIYSSGTPTTFGSSAIADWNSNKAIALTTMMGKVIMGSVPVSALLGGTSSIQGYFGTFGFQSYTGTTPGGQSVTGALLINTSPGLLNWYLGAPFYFTASMGATLPTNVSVNVIYYLIPLTTTTALVATTFSNALTANGPNSLTAQVIAYGIAMPSGTFTLYMDYQGSYGGEYAHTQLIPELAAHTHTLPTLFSAAGSGTQVISSSTPFNNNTGSTGSSVPFNVVQPSTFYNIYIKL